MKRHGVWVAALVAAGLLLAGCGGGQSGAGTSRSVDNLLIGLEHRNPLERSLAAKGLADLPADDLQGAVSALEKALQKEKDKAAKAAIEQALAKARGG